MTEYETATLAIQQSSLAIQQAQMEIGRLGLWAQIVIGAVQCILIAGGLWIMRQAAITRDKQHEEAKSRHEETMQALGTSAERTAAQHEEAMLALRDSTERTAAQHEEAKARHEESMLALRALIERTAPRPANDG